ncbi:MAG: DUF547 domain-containing protein [Litorimonas sp.]
MIHFSTNVAQAQTVVPSVISFTPTPKTQTTIDYNTMDLLLESMVLPTGLSTRLKAKRPTPSTGTRITIGHTSSYRLEGNRIPFYNFKNEYKHLVSDYQKELEGIGSKVDISSLPRNEQLAYWLNLHNVTMIDQIAKSYPIRIPRQIKVEIDDEKVLLNDAKILTINGQSLSLRDIRENIVYKNWKDPIVQYGFFLGDIGSPSIHRKAFTAENVKTILNVNAYEFTNSLRAFNKGKVSHIYYDNAEFFFPDFQNDVRKHITKYMRPEVYSEVKQYADLKIDKYHAIIADLSGGSNDRTQGLPVLITSNDDLNAIGHPPRGTAASFLQELADKQIKLRKLGLSNKGTVVIEDIEDIINDQTDPMVE